MKPGFAKVTKTLRRWIEVDPALPDTDTLASDSPTPEPTIPRSTDELIHLLQLTPTSVLTARDRQIIAATMSFSSLSVARLMLPKSEMTFVKENDILGPLMLDQLYQSGFSHFPVLDRKGQISGVIATDSLNSLAIKNTDRAEKFIDRQIFYLRDDYTLEQALAAFLRTSHPFFLVVNRAGELVGQLTLKMLMTHLLGQIPTDDFDQDSDRASVQNR